MDVKEHLGQFLSDTQELSNDQFSTVEQLTAIFPQVNKETLIAVVKYQSYFNPPGTNVLQHSIDFVLDNTDIINDLDIEVICKDAYNIIDDSRKLDGCRKIEDSKETGYKKDADFGIKEGKNSSTITISPDILVPDSPEFKDSKEIGDNKDADFDDKGILVPDSPEFKDSKEIGYNKDADISVKGSNNSSVTILPDILVPDSPELKDKLNTNNNFVEDSKQIKDQRKHQSIPCIDLDVDSLPAIKFHARKSSSVASKVKMDKEIAETFTKSPDKDNTSVNLLTVYDKDVKESSPTYSDRTSISFTSSSVPKHMDSNRNVLSQALSSSPVKALTNNFELAVSQEVYLLWKIEYKKKLAEKYSKSLKMLRSLTPNPDAERQLRQAYEEKLRLVETGQKVPRHLIKPKVDDGEMFTSSISSEHLQNPKHEQLSSTSEEKTDHTSTPKSKLTGSSYNPSPSTVPGVTSLLPKSPDILSPTNQEVHNTSFSEFVNRIVSENKLNTSIRSKANDTTNGSNNSSRTVSSITSVEDKDNVVTVVNTITISPTINSVVYSGDSVFSVPITNSSSICDNKNLGIDHVVKPSGIVLTAIGNTNTAEQLYNVNNNSKGTILSPAPDLVKNPKQILSQTSRKVKGLQPATSANTVTTNYHPQSTVSLLRGNSATIIRPSSFASKTSTPTRASDKSVSVKKEQYQLNKRSTPSATITSRSLSGLPSTKPQVLKTVTPSRVSWTPAGSLSTNVPPVNQNITTPVHQVLTHKEFFTPTIVPGLGSAVPNIYTPSNSASTSPNTAVTTTPNKFVRSNNYTPTTTSTNNTFSNQNTSSTPTSTSKAVNSSIPSTPTNSGFIMSSKIAQRKEVLQLFPDADPKYVDKLLSKVTGETAVNNVCSTLIDNPSYPRVKQTEVIVIPPSPDKNKEDSKIDYYTAYKSKESNCPYFREAQDMLSNDFRTLAIRDITAVLNFYKNYYAPAHKAFSLAFQSALQKNNDPMKKIEFIEVKLISNDKVEKVRHCRLLKNRRCSYRISSNPCLEFKKEMEFVAHMIAKEKVNADAEMARKLNEAQYTEAGANIECGCCYGEQPFEDMVQCYDGHLFCKSCLQSYVREAVFGSGKLDLRCMTEGCDSNFPESQLECCLETDVLSKYQERVREENLNLADLDDLVRCPHCEYAAIMDSGDKVFKCQNTHCFKETCRFCKEEWKDHIGIPCEELEKKDEAALRKEYEEKMTAAKVRTCHKCKSQFMKEEGCNKMTCRCGATMCYVCRKPSIHYNHFCQHVRDPGCDCKKCNACSLWSNPEEDDQRAVAEIQQEAQKKRREKGFIDDKLIGGTTSEPPAKKARKN